GAPRAPAQVRTRFTSHALLRASAAELATEGEDETARDQARQRLADHYLHTAAAAAGQLYPARPALSLSTSQPGTAPEQFTGYAEAQRWLGTEHQVLLAVAGAAAAAGHRERAWQLPAVLTDYLNREGHWHDLAAVGHTALAAAERAGDRFGQAHAHSSLGVACLQLGCYDTAHSHQLRAIPLFGEGAATSSLARTTP